MTPAEIDFYIRDKIRRNVIFASRAKVLYRHGRTNNAAVLHTWANLGLWDTLKAIGELEDAEAEALADALEQLEHTLFKLQTWDEARRLWMEVC